MVLCALLVWNCNQNTSLTRVCTLSDSPKQMQSLAAPCGCESSRFFIIYVLFHTLPRSTLFYSLPSYFTCSFCIPPLSSVLLTYCALSEQLQLLTNDRHSFAKMLRRCATFVPARPSMVTAAAGCTTLQKRFLKIAKSAFGFYLARRGQRKFPFLRRPHNKNTQAMNLKAPYFWSVMTSKNQGAFLPQENYITGDWTGKFFVSKRQVYTLQHAMSGAKVRVKSFPSVFEFNSPSRWNVGKEMNTLTKPRMDLIDDQMLTKKQRLDYVKAGLLPK